MRVPLVLAGLVAFSALSASSAHACKGQTELFNVNFNEEDAMGSDDRLSYGDGKMKVTVEKGKFTPAYYPESITDSDIDLCMTFKNLKETGQDAAAGLMFWASPDDTYYATVFSKGGNGHIAILGKRWKDGSAMKKVDYKKGADNTIRVTIKGTEGVAYINDKEFAKFKRKNPLDQFDVGVMFQDGEWEVSKFAGTSAD
jgi:hypothetical protein